MSNNLSIETQKLLDTVLNTVFNKVMTRRKNTYKNSKTNNTNYRYTKNTDNTRNNVLRKNDNAVNYISTLINKYYNNDNVANRYLQHAHKIQHVFPQQRRVIVIGDIHGDFDVAIKCLILAGCIENIEPPKHKSVNMMDKFFKSINWIGGDTYIVQLGDQMDRVRPQNWDRNDITRDDAYEDEGSTLEIFYLFNYLDELAKPHNGRVLCMLGNHEIMNVDGDFRYVSKKEFQCFKDHLKHIYHRNSKFPYNSKTLKHKKTLTSRMNYHNSGLPNGYRERLYSFAPTGLCANLMASNYYTMLQIGNWLFCHGSPTLHIAKTYSIDLINNIVALYLLGVDSDDLQLEKHFSEIMRPTGTDEQSILWSRTFGEDTTHHNTHNNTNHNTHNDISTNKLLTTILNTYNNKNHNISSNTGNSIVTHIAIGHTPQFEKGINSICNGKVWRCDIAMSRAFMTDNTTTNTNSTNTNSNSRNKNRIQVLEILNNVPRILS
jgi:hypothetical protein